LSLRGAYRLVNYGFIFTDNEADTAHTQNLITNFYYYKTKNGKRLNLTLQDVLSRDLRNGDSLNRLTGFAALSQHVRGMRVRSEAEAGITTGSGVDNKNIGLSLDLDFWLRKVHVSLQLGEEWFFAGSAMTRLDRLHLRVLRHF
jgi:hypothetical protein